MTDVPASYFFASLNTRFPVPEGEAIYDALPANCKELSKRSVAAAIDPQEVLLGYARVEQLIHPSWKQELISYLSNPIRETLCNSSLKEPLGAAVVQFLLEYAVKVSPFKNIPIQLLEVSSDMSFLLQIEEKHIQEIIELISIFSFVEPFRQILDKTRLKQLALILSSRQKKFLSFLTRSPKLFSVPLLDLQTFLKIHDVEKEKQLLLEKGIELFSQALYGEKEALIQLVCYKVEMTLGKKILCQWKNTQKGSKAVSDALRFVFAFVTK